MKTLYGYFRSSATYRVRIALAIKGVAVERYELDLRGGEHRETSYQVKNPQGLVPALAMNDELLGQSLAIIEYLDQQYSEPPLLPEGSLAAAKVKSLCYNIAMDIHPLNNLRVLQYLQNNLAVSDDQKHAWYQHWIAQGFVGLEQQLAEYSGAYCCGDVVSLADICLIPQVYNARRFECELSVYPRILAIEERCNQRPEFFSAAPEQQPEWEA